MALVTRSEEPRAHMVRGRKSQEPRAHLALVRRSEPKVRLGTRVIEFAVLCLLAIIIKINLKIQCFYSLFLFGILPVKKIN